MVKVTPTEKKEKKRKKFDALEGLCEIANRDGITYADKPGAKQKMFTMDVVCLDEVSSVAGGDQLALHERVACTNPTPDERIDSAADAENLWVILDGSDLTDEQKTFTNVKWGRFDGTVKSTEEMSTSWRWSLEKVQAFEQEIFNSLMKLLDPEKMSVDCFDRKMKKKRDAVIEREEE